MDDNLYVDGLAYFYTFVYSVGNFLADKYIYPDLEFYPDHTVDYAHTIHYPIPKPII